MNYFDTARKYSLSIFIYSSIILFSFAPFWALYSKITRLTSNIFYMLVGLSFFVYSVISVYKENKIKKCIIPFSLLLIFSILGISKAGITAFISYFTNFCIPICIIIVFYSSKKNPIGKQYYIFVFYVCVLINCLVGIYQVFSFKGDFSNYYIKDVIGKATFNYIRNGKLRAFGLLQSAVIFSNYVGISLIMTLMNIKRKKIFFIRILLICIQVYALILSGCRTPFLALFFVLVMFLLLNKLRKFYLFFSLLCIVFLLVFLTISSGMDLSALGRITQYTKSCSLILRNPFGYGIGYASFPSGIIQLDCAILTIPINFGIIGFIFLLILYSKILKRPAYKISDYVCDGLVMLVFILSGFANIIHLGVLTLVVIFYYLFSGESK